MKKVIALAVIGMFAALPFVSNAQVDSTRKAEAKKELKEKWKNATPEQKKAAKEAMREKWKNASPEQKEAMKKRMKEARAKKDSARAGR
jgi:predicted Holliday junction resolvase-like endonuclease